MNRNNTPTPAQPVVITEFSVYKPLAECKESLLIDSDTVIASIEGKTSNELTITVALMVRGSVSVIYEDQVYHKPSEFPEALRKLITNMDAENIDIGDMTDEQLSAAMEAFDPNDWEPRYEIMLNNWFEYIWRVTDADGDKCDSDGILCEDDLHTMTEDQLRSEMEEVVAQVLALV